MHLPDSSVHENILSVHEIYCSMWCSLPTFKAEKGAEFWFHHFTVGHLFGSQGTRPPLLLVLNKGLAGTEIESEPSAFFFP